MARDFDLQFPKGTKILQAMKGPSKDFDVWWKTPQDYKGVSCPTCGHIQTQEYPTDTEIEHRCRACLRSSKVVLKSEANK